VIKLVRLLGVLLLCGLSSAYAAAADAPARRALVPDDLARVAEVSDPRLSPDGRSIAYVLTTSDRDADEARSAIWMVSFDGTNNVALTHSAAGTEKPRWSPDGHYLAFLARPAGADKSQLMLLDRRAGNTRQLTSVTGEIDEYSWAPDGQRLVFAMTPADEERTPKPIVIEAWHFKQDEDGYLAVGHERHLYLLTLDSKQVEALTSDPQWSEDLPAWSPTGGEIAFVRSHEQQGPDRDGRSDIDVIEPRPGAAPRTLVRPFAPNNQKLAWSPSGTLLAYLQGLEPKYNAYMQDRLAVVPAAGGAPRPLTDKLDRAVMSYAFSGEGTLMLAVEDDRTVYPARLDLKSGSITRVTPAAPITVSALTSAGARTALLESSDQALDEVYALEAGRLHKLTAHNDALLASLALGAVEDIQFGSTDSAEIHGLLIRPPGAPSGGKYPTLLWIHGGPNGQDQHSLALDGYEFEPQMFASRGFLVLRVNYRGSSGRGAQFAQAIFADWGHKEVQDLLAGVDHLIALGLADPARLCIGGWSYGGILTDYTIATDSRFKVAVAGAGSANQLSTYGSDEYVLQYDNELGPPWRDTPLWLKVSYPFFHADRIRTPTLFLGGDKDFNVPIVGGEQMYQALRELGVPAQLVVYPGEHHILTRPSFVMDLATRIPAWIDRYLAAH
jgi:dipeptidyl aminopeptidase/acylaminoacyl peptidase